MPKYSSFLGVWADNIGSHKAWKACVLGMQENGIVCPYLENGNPGCSPHLNMRNIVQAFVHCAGRYENCAVFKEIRANTCKYEFTSYTATFSLLAAS